MSKIERRKKGDPLDRFSNLMMIFDSEGKPFISQNDVREIEEDLYGENVEFVKAE